MLRSMNLVYSFFFVSFIVHHALRKIDGRYNKVRLGKFSHFMLNFYTSTPREGGI